ncbi:MAG: hypothetical protein HETSPECPRED_006570 [Heterodermia speciosa]|uniref:Hcy-binding domain-containing protein n=1 Tax=Heterodermia speciosa TaxID=116794 RepID=A0A8H3FML5_9LECA|nr:MAG: hypothetical protein HETSPECPRED_006570 [Heterodermia speciosa]
MIGTEAFAARVFTGRDVRVPFVINAMPSLPVLLLDGGLGTCLESKPYNIQFSAATPLWASHLLISSPQTLLELHKAYVGAGSDVILTATYQASLEGFAATRRHPSIDSDPSKSQGNGAELAKDGGSGSKSESYSEEDAFQTMRSAVPLARKAFSIADRPGEIALSLGAYGATMRPSAEYTGNYVPEEMNTSEGLARWHRQRLEVFHSDAAIWRDVDYVAFETLPVLAEVCAIREAMSQYNSDKKWWISCVFPNDDLNLPDGTAVSDLVDAMIGGAHTGGQKPWGIGINCTSITKLESLIVLFEAAVMASIQNSQAQASNLQQTWPWLVVYPDVAEGLVYNTVSQTWDAVEKPCGTKITSSWDEEVAMIVRRASERALWKGILVGGCCKTTPDHIARLRARLIDQALYNQPHE